MDETELLRKANAINKAMRWMDLTLEPLEGDLTFAMSKWKQDKTSQFWRRCVIRCVFAYVESLLWNMKNATPKIAAISEISLSQSDLLFVAEERINKQTGAREKAYSRFPANVRQTFALYGKACCAAVEVKEAPGFTALCKSYELRGKLLHPKTPFDVSVSDPAIEDAKLGIAWFSTAYEQTLDACREAITKRWTS